MSGTPLLVKPSLGEVKAQAVAIGLSPEEAERFFYHYESNGWKVGKVPMKCWKSALQGWRLRSQQRARDRETGGSRWIAEKEYERILERLKAIRSQYGEHQTWQPKDVAEYRRLRDRKEVLKQTLGVLI